MDPDRLRAVDLHRNLSQKWSILASITDPPAAPWIFENDPNSFARDGSFTSCKSGQSSTQINKHPPYTAKSSEKIVLFLHKNRIFLCNTLHYSPHRRRPDVRKGPVARDEIIGQRRAWPAEGLFAATKEGSDASFKSSKYSATGA